jgi:DNA-binding NarL/FixJ family response regulator
MIPRQKIRLLVVEPHPLIRSGLISILEREPDVQVVGECAEAKEAATCYRTLLPDLVLMDAGLASVEKGDGIAAIRSCDPQARLLLLCTLPREAPIDKTHGTPWCWKDSEGGELVETIRRLHQSRA